MTVPSRPYLVQYQILVPCQVVRYYIIDASFTTIIRVFKMKKSEVKNVKTKSIMKKGGFALMLACSDSSD